MAFILDINFIQKYLKTWTRKYLQQYNFLHRTLVSALQNLSDPPYLSLMKKRFRRLRDQLLVKPDFGVVVFEYILVAGVIVRAQLVGQPPRDHQAATGLSQAAYRPPPQHNQDQEYHNALKTVERVRDFPANNYRIYNRSIVSFVCPDPGAQEGQTTYEYLISTNLPVPHKFVRLQIGSYILQRSTIGTYPLRLCVI